MIATFKARSGWSKRILVSLLLTAAALLLSYSNVVYRWDLFLYDWNRMAWSRVPA